MIALPRHHALLCLASHRGSVFNAIRTQLASSDRYELQTKSLGIDQVRDITLWHSAHVATERVAIISFYRATEEAQNGLLKLLEEPKLGTTFILILSTEDALLPTLRSRMMIVGGLEREVPHLEEAEHFFSLEAASRLSDECVKGLLDAKDGDKKDRERLTNFFAILELYASRLKLSTHERMLLRKCVHYSEDQSSSGKQLIEMIALAMPVVK